MDDPIFNSNNIVGGSSANYTFSAMSREIHSNQSFILIQTFTEADGGGPFDISSSTSTLFVSAFKNASLDPTALTSGALSDSGSGTIDTVTFTVPKDLIPVNLGSFPQRNGGNCRFFYILEDTDSILEFGQGVNVIDPSYGLTGEVEPSSSTITTQRNDLGTVEDTTIVDPPAQIFGLSYIVGPVGATGLWLNQENNLAVSNGSSWIFTLPEEGNFVYDKALAAQKTFGTSWEVSAAGAMLESVYDPQNIIADTFDRANMTGTQLASTISDIQTTITNNTEVLANTAKVTNATHTGDATGDTALTLANAAITGKATVALDPADFIMISQTSDSGNLKKVLGSDFDTAAAKVKKKTISATTYPLTDADIGYVIYFDNVTGCTVDLDTGRIDGFNVALIQDTVTSVITLAGTATLKAGSDLTTSVNNDIMVILPRPTTDEYLVTV
jgi:hypothetical protein